MGSCHTAIQNIQKTVEGNIIPFQQFPKNNVLPKHHLILRVDAHIVISLRLGKQSLCVPRLNPGSQWWKPLGELPIRHSGLDIADAAICLSAVKRSDYLTSLVCEYPIVVSAEGTKSH